MISSQKLRDRSRSTQRQPLDLSSSRPVQASSPGSGSKRLFSNRKAPLAHNSEYDNTVTAASPSTSYSDKRHRSGNWPLPDSSPPASQASRNPLQNRNAPNSPRLQRPTPLKRPSKFVEGSMNDRASQVPDTVYLGIEQDSLMENHAWEQATRQRPNSCVPTTSNVTSAGASDVSKHSSIFRFGKSIAATFNPSNWKVFGKQDRNEQEVVVEDPQQKLLRERQEKAEKIYAELKQTGHFPTIRAQNLDILLEPKSHVKHDSGVSFAEDRNPNASRSSIDFHRSMSREDKRKGMVFLDPPSATSARKRGISPSISNFSTPSRSSFQNLKRNSLSNIKKKFNYEHSNEGKLELDGIESSASRIPSRKDLHKQQKLVKRVSDLESKLESARRRLNESVGEPLPPVEHHNRGRRRKFVPGAMPTLPSERLLAGYVALDEEEENEIGKAVSENIAVNSKQTRDQPRGRSRVVREPEVSPSHFYPPSSPLTEEALRAQEQALKNFPSVKLEQPPAKDSEQATTEVSVSTKISEAHSLYVDEGVDEESEVVSAAESSSVLAPTEPESEGDFVTPKATAQKSASITPKKLAATTFTSKVSPAGKLASTTKAAPLARKRKALADNSGVYKPTGSSTSGDSEFKTVKKPSPRRKAVAPSTKIPGRAASPRAVPTVLPAPVLLKSIETDEDGPNEPRSKTAKKAAASSPSSLARPASQIATANAPVRAISRKAVGSQASRSSKPPSASKNPTHPRARQSASPPPSATIFNPRLSFSKSSAVQDLDQTSGSRETDEVTKADELPKETEVEELVSRRVRGRSNDVPPMPKLPKTVRLPSGEVVDVKVRAPVVAPRSGSRAGSRTRSVVSSSRAKISELTTVPKLASTSDKLTAISAAGDPQKTTVTKSDTRSSFEWPPDCF